MKEFLNSSIDDLLEKIPESKSSVSGDRFPYFNDGSFTLRSGSNEDCALDDWLEKAKKQIKNIKYEEFESIIVQIINLVHEHHVVNKMAHRDLSLRKFKMKKEFKV